VLLYYQKHQIRNVLFLSLFLITLSFLSIVRTVIFFDESNWLVAVLFNTFSPLYYLIGPFLYLYIRDFLTQNQKLKKIHLLHFLPALLQFINLIPYLAGPFEQKLMVARAIHLDPLIFQNLKINMVFSFKISSIIPPILVVIYAVYCLIRQLKNSKQNQIKPIKAKKRDITSIWLVYLCVIISLIAIANIYFGYSFSFVSNRFLLKYIILFQSIFIASIPISLIVFPQILYGIIFDLKLPLLNIRDKKSKESIFSPDIDLEELSKKIHEIMEKDNNFLSNEFSLDQLVMQLNVPKYHVYQCLNEKMKVKFSDLRSQYRVEYAKKLLLDLNKKNITIEAIGDESGFPTRSSFYRAFKSHTGVTPKDFIRESENLVS
jgi:AraC-like DNA-binding protein